MFLLREDDILSWFLSIFIFHTRYGAPLNRAFDPRGSPAVTHLRHFVCKQAVFYNTLCIEHNVITIQVYDWFSSADFLEVQYKSSKSPSLNLPSSLMKNNS